MDTIETTVAEDALAKDAKSASAADPCEMKSAGKPDGGKTSFGTAENEENECCEEPDDLLEKIEEAVKDKVIATNSSSIDNDISESSEHEFLKRLEELEKDNNAASGANADECDKITVGKLVLDVGADKSQEKAGAAESNGEEHVNELSSTTEEKVSGGGEEKGKDKDSKQAEAKSSEDASCDLKKNGKLLEDLTEAVADKGAQNEASGAPEVVEIIEVKAPKVSSTEEKKTEASSSSEKLVDEITDIPKEGEKIEKASHENEEAIGSTTADEKLEEHKTGREAPRAEEGKKEEEKKKEASSEAMAVDDDDDDEPMEIDMELKMDIDPDDDDDDDCQIIDEEMAPASESKEKAKGSKDLDSEVQEPIVDSAKKEADDDDVQIIEPESIAAQEPESNEAKAEEKVSKMGGNLKETPKKQEGNKVNEEKTPDSTTVSSQSENISLIVGKSSEKKATSPLISSPGPSKKDDSPEATSKKFDPPVCLKKAECGSSVEKSDIKLSKIGPSSSKPQVKYNTKGPDIEINLKKPSPEKTAPQSTEKVSPKIPETTEGAFVAKSLSETKSVEPDKSTKDKCNEQIQKPGGAVNPTSKVVEEGAAAKDVAVIKKVASPKEAAEAKEVAAAVISPKRNITSSPIKKLTASSSAKKEEKQPEADSTKGEDKAAKVVPDKAPENVLEDEKSSDSDPAPSQKESELSKVTEVKDHNSDTTVSLSSTADEQILKLCMDTTPSAEVDNEHGSLKIENKALKDVMKHGGSISSLNATPDPPVFKSTSTPIQKQFDISSEATEITRKTIEDDLHHTKPNKIEYSSDMCTTTDHHHSSSSEQQQSSGSVTKYVNAMKKFNGITDSTTDEDSAVHIKNTHSSDLRLMSSAGSSDLKSNNVYEINVQYGDRSEISFLSIEKLDSKKLNAVLLEKTTSSEVSDQGSSNGSVTSITPFTLPVPRLSEVSSSSSGSTLPQESKLSSSHSKRKKFTLQGTGKLCNFIIDEFTKLKKAHCGDGDLPTNMSTESKELKIHDEPTTPKSQHREYTKKNLTKGKSASPAMSESSPSPLRSEPKRSRKRSFTKSQDEEEEDEGRSKAKQPRKSHVKSQGTPSKEIESSHCELTGQCVLAKWVDKKYYAGRITGEKPGNKYVVLFEDGASKTLPKDSIVFGEGDTLPLKDMHVHGLVDDDFENGVVISIDKVEEKVLYTVQAELKQVKITASDIYLTEEQAKAVQGVQTAQKKGAVAASSPEESTSSVSAVAGSRSTRNKRTSTSPVTPEPGYSGGVGKKGAKRQKRGPLTALNRISESSELSDTQESSPTSLDASLELVEGLQPELQPTDKDAELSKMIFIADYLECHPTSHPREMLGKLPDLKTLFRNKCFILTCTVGLKPHRYVEVDQSNVNSKSRQFSKVPFVKSFLQKQIEEGGGVVYKYFEEIPKKKYRQCKLITPQPCTTAKFVQCLAADIQAVSHEWIIDSCNSNILEDVKKYALPSGWSILTETYIQWDVGKSTKQRFSRQPLNKTIVLLGSGHKEFITFWSRVCRLAGATIRYIKYIDDVTPTTKGIMVCDLDFPDIIKSKAAHFDIPIVSTVWIIQCLINGRACEPSASPKLQQIFPDDDF